MKKYYLVTLVKKIFSGLGLACPVFRLREWTRTFGFRKHSAVCPDGFSLPPARLIVLVTGSADARWYVEGGRLAAEGICETMTEAGIDVINDGEQPRVGFQTYVPQRMKGFAGESRRPPPAARPTGRSAASRTRTGSRMQIART